MSCAILFSALFISAQTTSTTTSTTSTTGCANQICILGLTCSDGIGGYGTCVPNPNGGCNICDVTTTTSTTTTSSTSTSTSTTSTTGCGTVCQEPCYPIGGNQMNGKCETDPITQCSVCVLPTTTTTTTTQVPTSTTSTSTSTTSTTGCSSQCSASQCNGVCQHDPITNCYVCVASTTTTSTTSGTVATSTSTSTTSSTTGCTSHCISSQCNGVCQHNAATGCYVCVPSTTTSTTGSTLSTSTSTTTSTSNTGCSSQCIASYCNGVCQHDSNGCYVCVPSTTSSTSSTSGTVHTSTTSTTATSSTVASSTESTSSTSSNTASTSSTVSNTVSSSSNTASTSSTSSTTASTSSTASSIDSTTSTTLTCANSPVLGWYDPCVPDTEIGCALTLDIDAEVCVITGAMTRGHLRNSIRNAMKEIITGLDNEHVLCSVDKMYLKDISVDGIDGAVHGSGFVTPSADNCPVVVDECGTAANDEPQFDVGISLALRCGDASDDCRELQILAKLLYDFAQDGVLGNDFANHLLSNSVDFDEICKIGLGRVAIEDTITVTLTNQNGDVILLLDVDVYGSGAASKGYLVGVMAVMAVLALLY